MWKQFVSNFSEKMIHLTFQVFLLFEDICPLISPSSNLGATRENPRTKEILIMLDLIEIWFENGIVFINVWRVEWIKRVHNAFTPIRSSGCFILSIITNSRHPKLSSSHVSIVCLLSSNDIKIQHELLHISTSNEENWISFRRKRQTSKYWRWMLMKTSNDDNVSV